MISDHEADREGNLSSSPAVTKECCDSGSPVDPYSRSANFVSPLREFRATLRQLGPGIILVGSIVGSGELIMTTQLGAVAGFAFLWFVVLSCFLKVVVQAELARHTISSGRTFLSVFNDLPGPSGPRPLWLTVPWMTIVLAASTITLATYLQLPESWQSVTTGIGMTLAVVLVAFTTTRQTSSECGCSDAVTAIRRPSVNWFTWIWLAVC